MNESRLSVAAATDVGCKRKNNEDSLLSLPECGLFCVADGMGGAREGQVASKALTDALQKEFQSKGAESMDLAAKSLLVRDVVNQVNTWIKKRAAEQGFAQMGSTLVSALFDEKQPDRGIAIHAGDSRLYCYRQRILKQLTVDHTFIAALAAQSGGAVDESAVPAAWRGVVTKAVGKLGNTDTREKVDLDETAFDVQPGDLFILCSDGLTRMLPDKMLQGFLRRGDKNNLDGLVATLLDEAKKAGGDDNISVVLIKTPGGDFSDNEADEDIPDAIPEPDTATPQTPLSVVNAIQSAKKPLAAPIKKKASKSSGKDLVEGDTPNTGEFEEELESALSRPKTGRRLSKVIGTSVIVGVAVFASVMIVGKSKKPDVPTVAHLPVAQPAVPITAIVTVASAAQVIPTHVQAPTSVPVLVASAPIQTKPVVTSVVVAVASSGDHNPTVAVNPAATVVITPATSQPVVVACRTNAPVVPVVVASQPATTNVPVSIAVASVKEPAVTNVPPVVVAAVPTPVPEKSEEEKQKDLLENTRQILASGLAKSFKTGQWGELKRQLGSWADKLDQLEPTKGKRVVLLAWMNKWDEAARAADVSALVHAEEAKGKSLCDLLDAKLAVPNLSGTADDQANSFSKYCYDRQVLVSQKIEAFVSSQEKQMQSFGKQTESRLSSLAKFLDAKDSDGVCDRLYRNEKRYKELRAWLRSHPSEGVPLVSEDYAQADVKGVLDDTDVVWHKLYNLVEPAGELLSSRQVPSDQESRLVNLLSLHKKIVGSRKGYTNYPPWRSPESGGLLREFITELDLLIRALPQSETDSK